MCRSWACRATRTPTPPAMATSTRARPTPPRWKPATPRAAAAVASWCTPPPWCWTARCAPTSSRFNASGAGGITVSTQGGLKIEGGANFALQRGGSLTLSAAGEEGIYLGGDISGAGASVSVTTKSAVAGTAPLAGGITLAAGRRIDVAGDVVNQRRDGGLAGTGGAGGQE